MKKNCKNCIYKNNCQNTEYCKTHNRHYFTPIMKNRILFSKDGRKIGNSICSGTSRDDKYYHIITDYGNASRLSVKEIDNLFYYGGIALPSHKNYS